MRQLFIILTLIHSTLLSFGQIFNGTSTDKMKSYNCSLKINKDSSVVFIYNTKENETYGEHFGTIKKVNDSVFHISATMTFGKFDNIRQYTESVDTHIVNDTDYFGINTTYIEPTDTVCIKYCNGQTNYFVPVDKQGKNIAFPLDKKLFNKNSRSNFYTVIIKRKNVITRLPLTFKVKYGSSASFESGEKLEFNIVIKNNNLWSTDKPVLQTGHFKLTKKSGT